jgi:hypothetical protein
VYGAIMERIRCASLTAGRMFMLGAMAVQRACGHMHAR